MRNFQQSSRAVFVPSSHSARLNPYGEGEVPAPTPGEVPAEEEGGFEKYIGIGKALLGLDDPGKELAVLQSRLRILQGGGSKAVLMAVQVGAMGNVPEAIRRIQEQITSAENIATQSQTRDTMYTAIAVTGVALGGMIVLFVGMKALGGYRQSQIQAEELKQLRSKD